MVASSNGIRLHFNLGSIQVDIRDTEATATRYHNFDVGNLTNLTVTLFQILLIRFISEHINIKGKMLSF